jgi:hypothetical protein
VRHLNAALALAAFSFASGGARALAHPPPEGTWLVWVPTTTGAQASSSSERLFIRTQRGFLVESPATNDFRFLCNSFLGVQDGEDASFAHLGGGDLLLTTYAKGALIGSSDGCTWTAVTRITTVPAFDVTVAGNASDTTAYVVGGAARTGDHFWLGRNAGTTWSPLANADYPYTRVRVAASNPSRLYLTGIGLSATGTAIHRMGVSDDGGKTVVDRLITLGANDLQARVLDIDPQHPDHVYVYVESNGDVIAERVMVTDDAGQSFQTAVTMHAIGGFAQSDDGSRVWVGGKEGIYRSVDNGGSFAPVASPMSTVTCLAFHSGRIYACGFLNNQLMVAVSDDYGDSFNKIMSFDQITQTADCPGMDPASAPSTVCTADMDHWRVELGTLDAGAAPDGGVGGVPVLDSGGSSGGSGGSGGATAVRSTSSGCAVAGPNHGPGSVLQLIVVVAALLGARKLFSPRRAQL